MCTTHLLVCCLAFSLAVPTCGISAAVTSGVVRSVRRVERQPQKWIYAFQTCANDKYVKQLEGQMRTWAANISEEDKLIIGGPHDNGGEKLACDEGPRGQNCKEATVLYRAAHHAQKVGADWLFHIIDDAYLFLPRVWKAMEAFDPSEPVVFANFGCGRAWQYHEESDGGKKPKPKGWVEPAYHCDKAWKQGGICTGAGYIVSRAALNLLPRDFTLPSFVKHYTTLSEGRASDISTSCLMYDRGIKIRGFPNNMRMQNIRQGITSKEIVQQKNVVSVHVSIKNHSEIPLFMDELRQTEASGNELPSSLLALSHESEAPLDTEKFNTMPKQIHVAVLMRGQVFRNAADPEPRRRTSCVDKEKQIQLKAAESLVENVVKPLEANNNNVEFFVLVGDENCSHTQSLLDIFGGRIRATKAISSMNQGSNMRHTLDLFKEEVGKQFQVSNVMDRYGLIIIARHDLMWAQPMSQWPGVNYDAFNFISQCEDNHRDPLHQGLGTPWFSHGGPKENCVNDVVHMMRGSQFAAFAAAIGKECCFMWTPDPHKSGGHGCYPHVAALLDKGEQISFLTDWRPEFSIREHNDISNPDYGERTH